jgi:uncharacterized protein YoxC
MQSNLKKSYDNIDNKLKKNWDDVQTLIALHNEVLKKIELLQDSVNRLWNTVRSTYEGI